VSEKAGRKFHTKIRGGCSIEEKYPGRNENNAWVRRLGGFRRGRRITIKGKSLFSGRLFGSRDTATEQIGNDSGGRRRTP